MLLGKLCGNNDSLGMSTWGCSLQIFGKQDILEVCSTKLGDKSLLNSWVIPKEDPETLIPFTEKLKVLGSGLRQGLDLVSVLKENKVFSKCWGFLFYLFTVFVFCPFRTAPEAYGVPKLGSNRSCSRQTQQPDPSCV